MTDWTTITVSPDMRDRLKALKRGGESYSELIERLIEESGVEDENATELADA